MAALPERKIAIVRALVEAAPDKVVGSLRHALARTTAESAPGSGLGLSIIDELARAYRGSLVLGDSALGGLSVTVDLPRAEA